MIYEMKRKILILIILIFVGFLFVYLYQYSNFSKLIPFTSPAPIVPYEVEIKGQHVCLPHKNTRGAQTLECALGIMTEEDVYYALDLSALPSEVTTSFGAKKNLSVKGLMVPVEQLSSDYWQKYNIKGIIQVENLEFI